MINNLFKMASLFFKMAEDLMSLEDAADLLGVSLNASKIDIEKAFINKAMPFIMGKKDPELIKTLNEAKDLLLEKSEGLSLSEISQSIENKLVDINKKEKEVPIEESLLPEEYLYHITMLNNLESISSEGLRPGSGQSLGHGGNIGRSFGNIFLTDKNGISHWYHIAERIAEDRSDNLLEDLMIPVVLRIPKTDEDKEDTSAEGYGYLDQAEYKIQDSIDPDDIEVWDGKKWVGIEQYDNINPEDALDIVEEESDEEESDEFSSEPIILYYIKDDYKNPLLPK